MINRKKKAVAAIALAFTLMLGAFGCGKVKDLTTERTTPVASDTNATRTEDTEASTQEEITEELTAEVATEEVIDTQAAEAEQKRFDEYMDKLFREEVVSDTITLHYTLAHPENFGITDYEVTFGDCDMTDEGFARYKAETEANIAELEGYDYGLLSDDQRFLYDILINMYKTDLVSYDYPYLYEPFAYTSGLQTNYPITMAEYKFYDEDDIKDYLKLLELTPDYYQAYLDFEKVKSEKGLFMNSNSAEQVIKQCSDFIKKPDNNVMIATFATRLDNVEGLSEDQKKEYISQNEEAVKNYVIPTYENVINVFTELKDTGKNELGLKYLEGGQDYYKYLMASKVGTDKTPEEIIALLDEAIKASMDELTSLAFANYSAYSQYYEDYGNLYEELDEKETIEYFEKAFDDKFPDIPDIDFTVTPVHESLKDSVSPAFFMTPPMDEYTNNSIYINEGTDSIGSLWATLAHEGVPGHMYQFVYFLSNNPTPIRALLSFNGYEEGWAQYVENMSYSYYDKFKEKAYADFERNNSELNLFVSARVEIGINYEGWTLEDTENYLTENGFGADAAKSLMDYVVAEPGNYQMYCTGMLSFRELRSYAEEELGNKFDEKEFHKTVLDAGPCQFFMLKQRVDAYIDSVR